MSYQVQIARTIASQIGTRRMWALGAKKLTAMPETDKARGGLTFKASLYGRQQCLVTVVLTPADLYDYVVFAPRSMKALASGKGVFCEDIGAEIECAVERHFSKAN